MRVFNTLSRRKEEFVPITPNEVKMYVCGPTVYNYIHIGNARPLVVFDAIRRYLEYKNYKVTFVSNFTDVDDKIIKKANEENVKMNVISERYILAFKEDTKELNIKEATFSPKVTEEIPEIIDMIKSLIKNGYAYEKNGTVYYNVEKFKDYGKLSHKKLDELEFGSRIDIDSEKQNPMDFVLWKPKKDGEEYWDSPWGQGRPGWHIECSAMARKYLGDSIDIHAGGEDLIFPHHENEIAQSEGTTGKTFSKYWLHNGFINVDNKKMSKSEGNFFTVRDILEKYNGDVLRFFILSSQYRSPINFSAELLESASSGLERIKSSINNLEFLIDNIKTEELMDSEIALVDILNQFVLEFENKMEDDFNTADAISIIFELVRFANTNVSKNSSKEFAKKVLEKITLLTNILGIIVKNEVIEINTNEIEELINKRNDAKKNKDFKLADEIRNKLSDMGIILEDTRLGVKWSLKGKK